MFDYPLDNPDFIMMDLERPPMRRFGDFHAGEHTGRLLAFLAWTDGVDGVREPRLAELFERIWRQRRPSGHFGRYSAYGENVEPEADFRTGTGQSLLRALVQYYETHGDPRALEGAVGLAEQMIRVKDKLREWLAPDTPGTYETWSAEPFARLYAATGDNKYLDMVAMFGECIRNFEGKHAHGMMTALRGLQLAAIYTGDKAWNEKPEFYRRRIIEEKIEMADGCISETFPRSYRNEGCQIADWVMLNLNAGFITGDAYAYNRAENALWNALFFNQFVNGLFGHRTLTEHGYGTKCIVEAWNCCVSHCGIGMTEYARHAVIRRQDDIWVNLLVSGDFRFPDPGGREVKVSVVTEYPARAETTIEVENMPENGRVHVRVPACVRNAALAEERDGGRVRVRVTGNLGHWLEDWDKGVVLRYGPLVLAPSTYFWNTDAQPIPEGNLAGYIPESLPAGIPSIVTSGTDANGFLVFEHEPRPKWYRFEEGPGARLGIGKAAVNVPVRFDNGEERTLRFSPLCYVTSSLAYYETPIVFKRPSHRGTPNSTA